MSELEEGDFIYQADQELFLVCIDENDDSYEFAVHGWRTIGKERLDRYMENDPTLQSEAQVEEVVRQADDPQGSEKLGWLKGVFEQYQDADIEEESAHSDFALDDTP